MVEIQSIFRLILLNITYMYTYIFQFLIVASLLVMYKMSIISRDEKVAPATANRKSPKANL